MALHPDIEGFLELAEFGRLSGKSQPMHELTPGEARQQFEQTAQLLDEAPTGALTVTAVSIPARDGHWLNARLFAKPQSGSEPRPVLLYFHGGGYVVGSLDSHDTLCRRLALAGSLPCCRRIIAWRLSTGFRLLTTTPKTSRVGSPLPEPKRWGWTRGG